MAGAHLDSVPEGPGINDNGSGVAAVLETAVQLGSSPEVKNAVRFGFWAAEEEGLVGSHRVRQDPRRRGAQGHRALPQLRHAGLAEPRLLHLRRRPVRAADARRAAGAGGLGGHRAHCWRPTSATRARQPRDTSFDGRSDYDGFTQAGIPAGGLFAGAEDKKSADEAKLWGGAADEPFDPNYHKASDTYEHLDRDGARDPGQGGRLRDRRLRQDDGGRNGVPAREDRTRHVVSGS